MSVNIVVVNYNGGRLVEHCLRSLYKTSYSRFEVIVIDNASTDSSPNRISRLFPKARLIRLRSNLGYAAANNIGIRAAKGKYLVLLNSDTEVDPDWLTELVQVARQIPYVAFLQPKILFLDNRSTINSAGNFIHCAGFGLCRGIAKPDMGQYDEIQAIGYASGACVMIPREVLGGIGLMDELFFAYGEDKDWGWRAMMLGYESVYVPRARVYHKWSAVLGPSPRKMYYLELERIISIFKNHSKRMLIILAPILILVEAAVLTRAFTKGWLRYKILSYAHALALRKRILNGRNELLGRRKISDSILLRNFAFQIQHPYLGKVSEPLNFLCRLFRRLLIL